MLPEAGFFEAEMMGRVQLIPKLPLAGDCSCISGFLELVGEGGLPTVQHPEFDIISNIVLSGHDLCTGRGADRIGETVGETHASFG